MTLTDEQLTILKEAEPDNFIVIRFSWTVSYIFPFEEGMSLLQSMRKMEQLADTSGESKLVTPVDYDGFTVSVLPRSLYIEYKMNDLLNVGKTTNV